MKTSLFALAATLVLAAAASAAPDDAKKVDFAKDVQPIFKASCVKCHGLDPDKPKKKAAAKLRLDDRDAAFKGGASGVAFVPGKSKDSLLVKLLSDSVQLEGEDEEIPPMPKVKKGETWKSLPADQVAVIKLWIDQGADWPAAK